MNLVGIDFSINSPSFCCYKDGKYVWGSLTRSDRSAESHLKSQKKPFFVLNSCEDFHIYFMDKAVLSDDYTERERSKILYFNDIVEFMWNRIADIMGDVEYHVAMEGLSFSSNGNALIDISMATALLRKKILETCGVDKFHVLSPTSIKKYAIKGNAKKDQLYVALAEKYKDDETNLSNFANMLEFNKIEWITPSMTVNKPIDDIVDATWIVLYLKDNLRKFYGIKEESKKELI